MGRADGENGMLQTITAGGNAEVIRQVCILGIHSACHLQRGDVGEVLEQEAIPMVPKQRRQGGRLADNNGDKTDVWV